MAHPLANNQLPNQVPANQNPPPLVQVALQPHVPHWYQAAAQTANANAGPQYDPTQPPWHRPHPNNVPIGNANRARWIGWAPNESIRLYIPLSQLPTDPQAPQTQINAFLDTLQQGLQVLALRRDRVVTIAPYEVSSRNATTRTAEFGVAANGTIGTLPIAQYSETVTTAVPRARLPAGTMWLVASRDNQSQPVSSSAGHRFVTNYVAPAHRPAAFQTINAPAGPAHVTPPVWHNMVVLAVRMPTPADAQGYLERIYVYDPSFVNENPTTTPFSTRLAATGRPRLQDSLLGSRMRDLVEGLGRGRVWARPGAGNVYVGGGGNLLDSCRRMAMIFMQQAGWLLQRLVNAASVWFEHPNATNRAAYDQRRAEFDDFFADYVQVAA